MDRCRARVPSLARWAGGRAARLGGGAEGRESRRPAHGLGARSGAKLACLASRGSSRARSRVHREKPEGSATTHTPHASADRRVGRRDRRGVGGLRERTVVEERVFLACLCAWPSAQRRWGVFVPHFIKRCFI